MAATRYSRYEFAPVHQDSDGRTFLDVPDPLGADARFDDRRVEPSTGETLESLAWKAYREMLDIEQDIGPSRFFWVVGEVNGVVDQAEIPVDKTFRIPSVTSLLEEILVPPRFYQRNEAT